MSKYISQYDEVVSSDSTDYYLLQRGTAYKKFTKANFFNQISNELGIGATTLVGLTDVDTTYLSNGDVLQYNSSTEMWDCVPMSGGASAMDDLTDVTITGLATNDVIAWNGSAYVNDATYARTSSVTTGFIPRSTGSNTFTNGTMTDDGTNVGFNTATYTYSFNFGGNTARSLGLVRHTTSNTAGSTFSLYAGGATSGATDKNGGNFDIYSGISTGTGTSQFNVYTCTAGSTGSTSVTPTVKFNINGAGTAEFTTSSANSKLRIGHNLKTVLSIASGIGIELSRVADGSYTINGGIYMVDNATYRMIIASANAGVAFVKNPASDTTAGTIINGTGTAGSFWCGTGNSSSYNFEFRRTWNDGGSAIGAYIGTTGTNTNVAQQTVSLYVNNNIVNSSAGINYGLQISTTGHTTSASNIALNVIAGRSLFLGSTNADFDISFGALANRTFGINREISSTAGRKLSIYGGSAALAATDLTGGNVEIITGTGTGTGGADIIFQTSTPGASGSTDRTPTTKMTIKGSGVINFSSLPTSSAGLSAGDIWSNVGILTIV